MKFDKKSPEEDLSYKLEKLLINIQVMGNAPELAGDEEDNHLVYFRWATHLGDLLTDTDEIQLVNTLKRDYLRRIISYLVCNHELLPVMNKPMMALLLKHAEILKEIEYYLNAQSQGNLGICKSFHQLIGTPNTEEIPAITAFLQHVLISEGAQFTQPFVPDVPGEIEDYIKASLLSREEASHLMGYQLLALKNALVKQYVLQGKLDINKALQIKPHQIFVLDDEEIIKDIEEEKRGIDDALYLNLQFVDQRQKLDASIPTSVQEDAFLHYVSDDPVPAAIPASSSTPCPEGAPENAPGSTVNEYPADPLVQTGSCDDSAEAEGRKQTAHAAEALEKTATILSTLAPIDRTLLELEERIETAKKNGVISAAGHRAALELFDALSSNRHNYSDALHAGYDRAASDFNENCISAIKSAKIVLEKEFGWGDYLNNLLRKFMNSVIRVVSFGHYTSNFFELAQPEAKQIVDGTSISLGLNG